MSLRRSARVATTSTVLPVDAKATNGVAKYTKVAKPAAAPKKRKAKATAPVSQDESNATSDEANDTVPSLPATPLPKKRKAKATDESPIKPPPFTPTPAGVGIIASSTKESGHPLESLVTLQPRPAEPHATNAPVSDPNSSNVVTFSSPVKPEDSSPVKRRKAKEALPPDMGSLKSPSRNIDTLLREAEDYLISVDPKLKGLIEKHKCKMFSPEGLREVVDPFTALASSIMGQQVRQSLIQHYHKFEADVSQVNRRQIIYIRFEHANRSRWAMYTDAI
jgi:DNA-3-methyladenine glycosylase II